MKNKYSEDIGEEIISRLKELIEILEIRFKEENAKERPSTHCN